MCIGVVVLLASLEFGIKGDLHYLQAKKTITPWHNTHRQIS